MRTGSTSRPRYVLHVGHMRCDSFGLPQTGQTESLGASILCWARRLSRRDFDVFRFGTAMSGRLAYLRARRLRLRYGLRPQVVALEDDRASSARPTTANAAADPEREREPADERLEPRRSPSRADCPSASSPPWSRIASPIAPPICWFVLISPDASPASSRFDARERGDRHGHEREAEPDPDQDEPGQEVVRRTSRRTEICVK